MGITNPSAGLGKATGSPAMKVFIWLVITYGIYATFENWWNQEPWFLLGWLDTLWSWGLKVSAAIK
jgi:hypothetical protein